MNVESILECFLKKKKSATQDSPLYLEAWI